MGSSNWILGNANWSIFSDKKNYFLRYVIIVLANGGTFMPLVILPSITFQNSNFLLPTLEGQYIIKNIIIIASALVVGRHYLNQPFFDLILKIFTRR